MSDDYEDLTGCALDEAVEHELVHTMRECVFGWITAKGEPFGVVMAYLPHEGKLWLTAAEHRARIGALRRHPRATICIHGAGTPFTAAKTVSYRGDVVIRDDRETKDWFYPAFARYLRPDEEAAAVFQRFLDSPGRVIIEFTPDYRLSFDGAKMWTRSPEVAR